MTRTPQSDAALEKANRVRLERAAVKRELRAGRLTFAAAIADPRAAGLTLFELIQQIPRYGRVRALRALDPVFIGERRLVGELTDRQVTLIKERVHA